jgi:transcriptional regulator with XRE-family HTH domain/quercetin dioxygenase-like cupin family protein
MPVYSTHLLAYPELELGRRIREARQRRGLTLRQTARLLETSSARLSQIENEQVRLDLEGVLRFADALQTPLDALIPLDLALPYQISRGDEIQTTAFQPMRFLSPGTRGAVHTPNQYRPLASLFVGRHLEAALGRIVPIDEGELCYCCHHEEEFTFVLRGTIEFRITTTDGERCEQLGRGDSVYFRSDLPHCFRSLESEPSETLHVFCAPSASMGGSVDWTHSRAIAHSANGTSSLKRQMGEKLLLLREEHGWPIERVARSAGLSERQMHAIERGERAIPLEAVLNLARAFGRPLRELIGLAVARPPYYFVRRSADVGSIPPRRRRTPVERPHAATSKTCQPLVAGFPVQEMYPCFLRMLNVDLETLALHEHHGQEFIYVLQGEVELTTYVGKEEVHETLRAGDSCYIDSTVPHLVRSWTRNPYANTSAELIDVFWCPLGETYLFDN